MGRATTRWGGLYVAPLVLAAAIAIGLASHVAAATFPDHPIKLIVPFGPGGPPDVAARIIGAYLSEHLGPVVVENHIGAGGTLAARAVAGSPPDGYTLLAATAGSLAISPQLYKDAGVDPVKDFAAVAMVSSAPLVVAINPSIPAQTVKELVAYAKANPGKLSYASAGIGTPSHLAGQLFNVMTGANLTHIPYKGDGPAMADFIGGQVPVMFATLVASISHIRAGEIRALGVTTTARSDALPDLPSISEFVPGYETSSWFGIGAPAGTPLEIVDKLNKETNAGLADPTIRARLLDMGCMLLTGTAADFTKLIADETAKWGKVIRDAGIKPQ
jgi:tripartite-type tricarboxylate transporter receptor subunit TctC